MKITPTSRLPQPVMSAAPQLLLPASAPSPASAPPSMLPARGSPIASPVTYFGPAATLDRATAALKATHPEEGQGQLCAEDEQRKFMMDGATFGATYSLRHAKRSFCDGRYLKGAALSVVSPVPAAVVAACCSGIPVFNLIIGEGVRDRRTQRLPKSSGVLK